MFGVGLSTDFRNDRNRVKPVKGSDDGLVSGDIFDDPTVRIASDQQSVGFTWSNS
jgi:hypothetical protein